MKPGTIPKGGLRFQMKLDLTNTRLAVLLITRTDKNGLEWTGMDRNGLEWTGMDWNEPEQTGTDGNGLERT